MTRELYVMAKIIHVTITDLKFDPVENCVMFVAEMECAYLIRYEHCVQH